MALAICTSCNARVHWHATRAARLKLIPCPVCGSRLRAPGKGEGYSAGRLMECFVCPGQVAWLEPDHVSLDGIWGLCRRHFGVPGVEQELARAVIDRAMYRAEDPGARLERVMAAYRRALEEHRVTA
jgi:DNA-directed RNA polymerase subunit RPC12/RpoP